MSTPARRRSPSYIAAYIALAVALGAAIVLVVVLAAILFALTYVRRRRIGESGPTLSAQ